MPTAIAHHRNYFSRGKETSAATLHPAHAAMLSLSRARRALRRCLINLSCSSPSFPYRPNPL